MHYKSNNKLLLCKQSPHRFHAFFHFMPCNSWVISSGTSPWLDWVSIENIHCNIKRLGIGWRIYWSWLDERWYEHVNYQWLRIPKVTYLTWLAKSFKTFDVAVDRRSGDWKPCNFLGFDWTGIISLSPVPAMLRKLLN